MGIIGQPLDRVDGRLKVTGSAPYAAESIAYANTAEAVLVQSTIGNGRIIGINRSAAESAPGVIAVLTPDNAPRLASTKGSKMQPGEGYPLLQDDKIYYNGQHIGLVVAETFEQATYAATLLRVRYDEQPVIGTLDQARDNATVPKNFRAGMLPPDSRRGDPETAFAAAPVKIDQTYTTPVEHHNPMEPHAVIAAWDGDMLTLHHSTQGVSGSQKRVSELFGIPGDKVHIVSSYVGGGFGSKGACWPHVTLAAMAARVVGRPVRLVLTRRQMYSAVGYRSKTIQHLRLGADREGKLVSVRHDGIVQTAPYGEFDEPVGLATQIMYACPNLAVTHRVATVNQGIPTFMRAPGEASGMFALESAMDELAYASGIDPVELRLRNYAEHDEHKNLPWSTKSLRACYEQGAARFGWPGRSPQPRSMGGDRVMTGWGMASATYPANRSEAAATVRLLADGSAVVQSGTQDIGTGTYTIMAQVAAQALGLPLDKVRAELGDSTMPKAPVSGGSQSAASVTPAVQAAAQSVRRKLIDLAIRPSNGALSGATADDIEIAEGILSRKSEPSRQATVAEVLARGGHNLLEATETTKPGDEDKKYSLHSFGAHFAEVTVDPEFGEVRVTRYVGAFAAGTILNAKTARSQFIGGIVYGMGMALTEETMVDGQTGRIVNANIAEYLVPVNADVPDITVLSIPEDDRIFNPLGVKGIGELPMVGTAAAIANAVYHATGIRVRDLPIHSSKISTLWKA